MTAIFEQLEPRLLLDAGPVLPNYPGDANLDGYVTLADLDNLTCAADYIAVKTHIGETEPISILDSTPGELVIHGSNHADIISVTNIGGGVQINGQEAPTNVTIIIKGNGGDDIISVVGGTPITVDAGTGRDIVWYDALDTVTSAEVMHECPNWVLDGLPLVDPPQTNWEGPTQTTNLAHIPLFTGNPRYTDVEQGSMNTSWLLATCASITQQHPTWLRDHIIGFGDRTYGVAFADEIVRIDADFWVRGSALVNDEGPLWPAAIEKAYASTLIRGYDELEEKCPEDAFQKAFGHESSAPTTASYFQNAVTALSDGKAIVATTHINTPINGILAPYHTYAVLAAWTGATPGEEWVMIYDPYSCDYSPTYDCNSADGMYTLPGSVLDVFWYLTIE